MSAVVVLLLRPAGQHVRAAELLERFGAKGEAPPVAALSEERVRIPRAHGAIEARLYAPAGEGRRPAVVLVHGVHYKGIDEPRLVRFARSVAQSGVVVMTPELAELADYRVDPASIDTVGASILWTRARMNVDRVGVMGFSFGGGLALLAAADARFADETAFVVAVGAHDDVARVSRFFAGGGIADPDGSAQAVKPHGYGVTVLVYGHVERFFAPSDVDAARTALRHWLREERDDARAVAKTASPAGRARLIDLFDGTGDAIRGDVARVVEELAPEMRRVSPHDRLGGLRAPVYLLHGSGDTVIPASETAWLARSVPHGLLRDALVSPAIVHVEIEGEPSWREKWAIVHFMARVLGEADARG